MLDNALKAAQRLIVENYNDASLSSLVIDEIKGYQTTNVYKLKFHDGVQYKTMYLKESSDINNELYNQFIQNEYINTEYVYKYFNSSSHLKMVEPVVFYKDLNIFFMYEIKGIRLDAVLKEHIRRKRFNEVKVLINMCKEWLREFHKVDVIKKSDSNSLLEMEEAKLKFLHNKFFNKGKSAQLKQVSNIVRELLNLRSSLVVSDIDIRCKHNDFAPWNILCAENEITVYDFADLNVDYKYYDLLYFYHSIEKLSKRMLFSKRFVEKIKKEIINEVNIPADVLSYYIRYFNLQDAASYLAKINQGGLKGYFYKYLYRKALRLAAGN